MKVIRLSYPLEFPIDDFPNGRHVMAIGDFDGLHLGHQDVVGHALEIARKKKLPVSIMTFDPHPREVLGMSQYSKYLAPFSRKMELFSQAGIDYTFVVTFTHEFAQVSAEDFIRQMLFVMNIDTIVVGFDFTFGHRGKGTVDTLRQHCAEHIAVEVVPPFHLDGHTVSSTYIREQLHLGRMDRVRQFLGRYYDISGQVVEGKSRGRTIGFPTANIQVTEPYVIPRHGVYAVKITIEDKMYDGVMNIGYKPTFTDHDQQPTLEVHLLRFSQNIYGKQVRVHLVAFLRDEQKFPTVDDLIQQIQLDIEQAEKILHQQKL